MSFVHYIEPVFAIIAARSVERKRMSIPLLHSNASFLQVQYWHDKRLSTGRLPDYMYIRTNNKKDLWWWRSQIYDIISLLRFGHTNSGFDILLESVIGQFYKKDDIDEVVKFFANKSDLGSLQRGVKKGNMFWDKIKTVCELWQCPYKPPSISIFVLKKIPTNTSPSL